MPRKMILIIPLLGALLGMAQFVKGEMPTWQTSGTSVQGRPLQCLEISGGTERVMVIAGFRGNRNASIQVAESLARHLTVDAGLADHASLLIVRDANPDGRALRTPTNARGVDLDRNFASSDWRKIPIGKQWLGGRQPVSEAETKWLTKLVTSWQPTRMVVLVDDGRGGWVRTLGADPSWQTSLEVMTALPWVETSLSVPSGSLASWVAKDLNIPTLLLNVPATEGGQAFWNAQQPLLRSVVQDATVTGEVVAGVQQRRPPSASSSRPKRRLVDVKWPQEEKNSELVRSTPNDPPLGRTISSRSKFEPIAGGPLSVQRIYRLPPADRTVPRVAPSVQRPASGSASTQRPRLPHRPIPIWVDPNEQ